jgi:hypothetical protein
MTDKEIIISVVIAAAGSLILTGIIMLLLWIGWQIVFTLGTIALIPVTKRVVKFWVDNDCKSLEDFLIEVDEYFTYHRKKKNDSDKNNRIM